jgi:hypothetical protein
LFVEHEESNRTPFIPTPAIVSVEVRPETPAVFENEAYVGTV